jgi:hypothetical protein
MTEFRAFLGKRPFLRRRFYGMDAAVSIALVRVLQRKTQRLKISMDVDF